MKDNYEFLTTTINGHILEITINRPDVMNSLHPPSHREFDEVWSEFTNEEDLWVAIITGAGDRAFSAGNDLKYQASGGDRSGMPESGFAGLTSRFNLNKPVIAAVNGVAMGGGMEIALACDLIIASSNARFALPEPKVGLAALAGGMQRLPRQIGMKNAMGMMLTGRHVGANEAKELGIVNGSKETFSQSLTKTTGVIGSKASSAELDADTAQALFTQAYNRNQSTSGVNLDEEAANMLKFQQAYQAASQIISVANTIFDTLLSATR